MDNIHTYAYDFLLCNTNSLFTAAMLNALVYTCLFIPRGNMRIFNGTHINNTPMAFYCTVGLFSMIKSLKCNTYIKCDNLFILG